MRKSLHFCALLSLCIASVSEAQIPKTISYQGVLTDASGTLVPDGNYSLTFKLYGVETGGMHLWAETQSAAISNGIFNVILGSVTTFPYELFTNSGERYLGVSIGSEPEMTPRIKLVSVPFAFRAAKADSLTGDIKAVDTFEVLSSAYSNRHLKMVSTNSQNIQTTNDFYIDYATTFSPGSIVFREKFNETMRIHGGGNVGIGTGSPGEKLQVAGVIHSTTGGFKFPDGSVQNTAGKNGGLFLPFFGSTSATDTSALEIHHTGTPAYGLSAAGFFQVDNTGNWSPALVSATKGTGPAGSFVIDNQSNSDPALRASTNGTGSAFLANHKGLSGDIAIFQSNGKTKVSIGKNGNMGIGTTSPFYKLHVENSDPEYGGSKPVIYGKNVVIEGQGKGALFEGGFIAVEGIARGGDNTYFSAGLAGTAAGSGAAGRRYGVWGNASGGETNYGVEGDANGNGERNYGVYGVASGTGGENYGVYGRAVKGTTNYAGYFDGDTRVTGTLTKGAGAFKIDHPLEPANKYLYHSFVESPDMMNVYNGNMTLDANGEVWVDLPSWFEALNRDFRYQLTCVGSFAPIYIAEKIANNRFKIAGGLPGMEVSWQVTGIRQDAFAETNRIPVEEDKPANERGKYIHPKALGMPETMGVDYFKIEKIDKTK